MAATYSDLQAEILALLNTPDLEQMVPTFIRLCEARIDRDLTHWRQERRSTATLDAQYSTIPSDFLRPIRLQLLDTYTGEVAPISTAQMLQMRQDRNDRVGRPEYYALTGGALELFPTPDGSYTASLVYYGRVPALSDANTTNWLLTEAPDVYLYGALVHAAAYLENDARAGGWEALFKLGLETLNTSSAAAKYGGTGLRMKTRRGAP